jgi:DNA polymerase III delta subunit
VSPPTKPVLLLWGEDPFLLLEAAREAFGDVEPTVALGAQWRPGLTSDLATPSLLGEPRGLLVTEADELPDHGLEEVARYASSDGGGALLVLCWEVGGRSKGPPKGVLTRLGQGVEVRRVAVERKDLARWVLARAKRRGLPATPPGASLLIQTVGEDPAALDQAVEQLAVSHPGVGVAPEAITAQFRGFGDRRTWELCDAAFTGDARGALRALAGMLAAGEEPLMILGGIAARVRDLLRVASLPPRTPLGEVARAAGLRFDWQARRYRDQVKRYAPAQLRLLHGAVAEADALIKQGGAGDVVLTMVVTRIAGAAQRGTSVASG